MSEQAWLVSPADAIARLCELQREYAEVMGYSVPRDCFCRDEYAMTWENDGSAIRFIEDATRAALAKLRSEREPRP